MKRFLKLFVCVALIFCTFSFIACGGNNNPQTPASPSPSSSQNNNNNPPQKSAEQVIIGDVYTKTAAYFTANAPTENSVQTDYNKYIQKQLNILNEIYKLSNIEKLKWYSGDAVDTQIGEANRVERFMISGSTAGSTTTIEIKLLCSVKGSDIMEENCKSYVLLNMTITYDGTSKDYSLMTDYESSRFQDNNNRFVSDIHHFEFNSEAGVGYYDITRFNLDDFVGSTNQDVKNFRAVVNSYLKYISEGSILYDFLDENEVRSGTSDLMVSSMMDMVSANQSTIDEILSVGSSNIQQNSELSQKLLPFLI